ncbi:MAG: GreA/GreB family elongation factor [Planctomycetota bacterium]
MSEQENEDRTGGARLRKLAVKRRYDELEAAWTDAVENDSVEPAELLAVLDKAARGAGAEFIDSLLWFLLSERAERKGPEDGLDVAKAAVPIFPESDTLRQETASLYRAAHASVSGIGRIIEMTLLHKDTPLPEAVGRIDKLLSLSPGSYVLDPAVLLPGKVTGLNSETEALEVAFGDQVRSYDAAAADSLERLEADDFRALFAFDPEKLHTLAHEQPDELVTRTLRALGPRMTFKTLKSRLAEIVPPAAWPKWWSMAKPKLRQAAWVEMSDKAQPTFTLRKQPIPYEARLKARFNSADNAPDKFSAVIDYLNEPGDPDAGVLQFFGRELGCLAGELRDADPAAALGALALTSEMHRIAADAGPAPDTSAALPILDNADLQTLMQPVHNDDVIRLILVLLREAAPGRWPEIYAATMPGCSQAGCDVIARELTKHGDLDGLRSAVDEILARPERHVAALCWLWRAAPDAADSGPLGGVDLPGVAVHLFSAAQFLARATSRKKVDTDYLLPQVRAAVAAREYALLHQALEKADAGRARRIKNAVERHICLSDLACSRVHEVLRRTHPDLFIEAAEPWEEDVIYTTAAGLKKRKDELQRLMSGKMAEAARAVGDAAQDGDLSENAGWTAALAERDRLATTATRMQEEISRARIIPPELAQSKTVTVGSAVDVKNVASGDASTMTFLGPWDVDHDRGIHAYSAGLGLAFMGKAKGAHVNVEFDGQEHTWEILDVRPAIQEAD